MMKTVFGNKIVLITIPLSLITAGFLCLTPISTFATPEPTRIPPPTATAKIAETPLRIEDCLYSEDCDYTFSIYEYFGGMGSVENNVEHPVTIFTGDRIRFFFGWCSLDQATLDENLSNMEFVFLIDGISYINQVQAGYYSSVDGNDPALSYPCFAIGSVLSGFTADQPHHVEIGFRLFKDIFDGWDPYEAGDHLKMFLLNPTSIATPVP